MNLCVSCGGKIQGGLCIGCGAFDSKFPNEGGRVETMPEPKIKPAMPSWKKEETVYCSDCELLTTKAKAKKTETIFEDERGYYCPSCGTKLADLDPEAKA